MWTVGNTGLGSVGQPGAGEAPLDAMQQVSAATSVPADRWAPRF